MAEKMKKVRLLSGVHLEGVQYPAGIALELPVKHADALVAGDLADDNAEAVKYALTQGELVVHQVLAEPEPAADPETKTE